jgi:hypothetical protein
MESSNTPKEESTLTLETGRGESGHQEKNIFQLPHFDNIWTSPPKALPGPVDHPFFTTRWESLSSELQDPHYDVQTTTLPALHSVPDIYSFGPPPVFPFVPEPSVDVLPTTPEAEAKQKSLETLVAGSPVVSTPGLTNSSPTDIDSSPRSRLSSFDHNRQDPALDPSSGEHGNTQPSSLPEEAAKTSPTLDTNPVCHSMYMRAIPSEATTEPAVLLNGQIWRSSKEKRKGWRRHQWTVDVR